MQQASSQLVRTTFSSSLVASDVSSSGSDVDEKRRNEKNVIQTDKQSSRRSAQKGKKKLEQRVVKSHSRKAEERSMKCDEKTNTVAITNSSNTKDANK